MKNCSVVPYSGDEGFIFISYSHKDSELIFPIIERMAQKGYRIWYDEGIDPGSEWSEFIANNLSNCSAFIAFISDNSLNSHNCRREITYAIHKQKPFVSIFLEDAKMTPGMEMQLTANQAIHKYSFDDEEKFYKKLFDTSAFAPCLGAPLNNTASPAEASEEEEDDKVAVAVPPISEEPVAEDPVAEEPAEAEIEESPVIDDDAFVDVPDNSKSKKKSKVWLLIIALIAVIAVVVVVLLLSGKDDAPKKSGSSINNTSSDNSSAETSGNENVSSESGDESNNSQSDDEVYPFEEIFVPSATQHLGENVSFGANYTTSPLYRQGGAENNWEWDENAPITYPDEEGITLTDGLFPVEHGYGDPAWVGFNGNDLDYIEKGYSWIKIDLGSVKKISGIRVYACSNYYSGNDVAGINTPSKIQFFASEDGDKYTYLASVKGLEDGKTATEIMGITADVSVRYVMVRLFTEREKSKWMFISEVEVLSTSLTEQDKYNIAKLHIKKGNYADAYRLLYFIRNYAPAKSELSHFNVFPMRIVTSSGYRPIETFTYDLDGKLVSSTLNTKQKEYYYDSDGVLYKYEKKDIISSETLERELYTYDEYGRLVQIQKLDCVEKYYYEENEEKPFEKRICVGEDEDSCYYIYNDKGHVLEEKYTFNGNLYKNTKYEYVYDSFGNIERKTETRMTNSQEITVLSIYNDDGLLESEEIRDNSKYDEFTYVEYFYEYGVLVKKVENDVVNGNATKKPTDYQDFIYFYNE